MSQRRLTAIGIGEILFDVFEDGSTALGGAPLNVTFHLNQLLHAFCIGDARIASCVGTDTPGNEALGYLEACGMQTGLISRDSEKPTGTALVFTQNGHAGYEITPNVAWDAIPATLPLVIQATSVSAVIFGSLAQRSELSRTTIQRVVAIVPGERLYDVNLRRNTRSGIAGYSKEIVQESLRLATIAKLNDEEIEEVAQMLNLLSSFESGESRQWDLITSLAALYDLSLVALTRGAKGALVLADGQQHRLSDSQVPQEEVHPVGAGDAFAAGLLFGRMNRWPIKQSLRLAETLANWVVRHVSATPVFTEEIMQAILAITGYAHSANSPSR